MGGAPLSKELLVFTASFMFPFSSLEALFGKALGCRLKVFKRPFLFLSSYTFPWPPQTHTPPLFSLVHVCLWCVPPCVGGHGPCGCKEARGGYLVSCSVTLSYSHKTVSLTETRAFLEASNPPVPIPTTPSTRVKGVHDNDQHLM